MSVSVKKSYERVMFYEQAIAFVDQPHVRQGAVNRLQVVQRL